MKVTFIQTGGTIDKDYPIRVGSYAFEINDPAVQRILKIARPNFTYKVFSILRKDSLEITDSERDLIYQTCKKEKSHRIVVTHGTDTMIDTAKTLSRINDKVIVLTGSHLPEKFRDSDAMFNVGTAIGALNLLTNGVYIAMNGRIYSWDKCKKDSLSVRFIEN